MNRERWQYLADSGPHPICMDWRHVQMLNAVLMNERPKKAVELGCYKGFSTTAIVEAIEQGVVESAELVDLKITPELRGVVTFVADKVTLWQMFTYDYHGKADFWMIDAGHGPEAIDDYQRARDGGAKIIAIHDTNSEQRFAHHFGAGKIGDRLKSECVAFFEDKAQREGEYTERGLVIGFFYQPAEETVKALEELEK